MPALAQLLFVGTALLAIGVLLYRVLQLEYDDLRAASHERTRIQPAPDPISEDAWLDAELLMSPLSLLLAECRLGHDGLNAEGVARIERYARRIEAIVARDGTQAEAHRRAQRERLDPRASLRAVVDELKEHADARGVTVHYFAEPTADIEVEASLLRHALRHLVRAAIDAAPAEHGDVTIAMGEIDGHALFAVADDGPGLDAHELAMIFEPGAAPFGYAVVSTLAQAFGGTFVLETGPGEGARATLKIPVVARTSVPTDPVSAPTVSV